MISPVIHWIHVIYIIHGCPSFFFSCSNHLFFLGACWHPPLVSNFLNLDLDYQFVSGLTPQQYGPPAMQLKYEVSDIFFMLSVFRYEIGGFTNHPNNTVRLKSNVTVTACGHHLVYIWSPLMVAFVMSSRLLSSYPTGQAYNTLSEFFT